MRTCPHSTSCRAILLVWSTLLLGTCSIAVLANGHSAPQVHAAGIRGSHHSGVRAQAGHAHRSLQSQPDLQHHALSEHRAAAAHHADVTIHPHGDTAAADNHAAGSADGDSKGSGCKHLGAAFLEESAQHSKEDLPVNIDPVTGREAEAEDIVEAAIAAEAKKAGIAVLEYETRSGIEAHSTSEHQADHHSSLALTHNFKLVYTLRVYFQDKAIQNAKWFLGDVYRLTQISFNDNYTLIESFETALQDAVAPALPDGIAEPRATNVALGEPLEVDLELYPDLLIPDEINPTQAMMDANKLMHNFDTTVLAPWFVEKYGVSEIQITGSPRNAHQIKECAAAFPMARSTSGSSVGRYLVVAVFVWCPLLLAMAVTAKHGIIMYQKHRRQSVLPKGSMKSAKGGVKSACGSSGGDLPNVASVYAAPVGYYAGPYRSSYSSGGGASTSSCRASSSGGAHPGHAMMSSPFEQMAASPCPRESDA